MIFRDTKPGDKVVYSSASNPPRVRVYTVDRVTKTQVIVKGLRFRKKDGRSVGEDNAWNYSCIHLPTPALLRQAEYDTKKSIALHTLDVLHRGCSKGDLTIEELNQVLTLRELAQRSLKP